MKEMFPNMHFIYLRIWLSWANFYRFKRGFVLMTMWLPCLCLYFLECSLTWKLNAIFLLSRSEWFSSIRFYSRIKLQNIILVISFGSDLIYYVHVVGTWKLFPFVSQITMEWIYFSWILYNPLTYYIFMVWK